jgi:hypothetical protein
MFKWIIGTAGCSQSQLHSVNSSIKGYEHRAKQQTDSTIFNKPPQLLAYVDDIALIGWSQADAREAFLALENEANVQKCTLIRPVLLYGSET